MFYVFWYMDTYKLLLDRRGELAETRLSWMMSRLIPIPEFAMSMLRELLLNYI